MKNNKLIFRDDSRTFADKRKRDFAQVNRPTITKTVTEYSTNGNGVKDAPKIQIRGFNDDESVVLRVDGDLKVRNDLNFNTIKDFYNDKQHFGFQKISNESELNNTDFKILNIYKFNPHYY